MSEELRKEYPEIEPYFTSMLQVSDLHSIYYEQSGNPNGNPAVVLHGGPGGGSSPFYRQFFNPDKYRIVMFDQRGAGKSTPPACLEQNTTWDLVEDIEKIRKELGIDKWIVFGGSWGSTLALAYAETYPERVKALVMRGIFTLRREELVWFYQQGASFCFPDAWEEYLAPIPEGERFELLSSYHRRLVGDNFEEKLKCAKAWSKWELSTSRLFVDPSYYAVAEEDDFALKFARIESHYFVNAGFFKEDGQLIKNAHILNDIPGTIVQGRYDMVCPMKTAWDLHKKVPSFELHVIKDAGHSCVEPGIIDQLVRACDKYANL